MSFVWLIIGVLTIWLLVTTWIIFGLLQKIKSLSKSTKTPGISFWNLYKFNPFNNTGGEQSFVLTLLDGHKNGIVMTILNGRGVTRFYAKKIENGNSQQQLSAEEIKCIKDSL